MKSSEVYKTVKVTAVDGNSITADEGEIVSGSAPGQPGDGGSAPEKPGDSGDNAGTGDNSGDNSDKPEGEPPAKPTARIPAMRPGIPATAPGTLLTSRTAKLPAEWAEARLNPPAAA